MGLFYNATKPTQDCQIYTQKRGKLILTSKMHTTASAVWSSSGYEITATEKKIIVMFFTLHSLFS